MIVLYNTGATTDEFVAPFPSSKNTVKACKTTNKAHAIKILRFKEYELTDTNGSEMYLVVKKSDPLFATGPITTRDDGKPVLIPDRIVKQEASNKAEYLGKVCLPTGIGKLVLPSYTLAESESYLSIFVTIFSGAEVPCPNGSICPDVDIAGY